MKFVQKWNHIGCVRQYTLDSETSLEIEYHDTSIFASQSLENVTYNYCLADLTANAYALVSKGDYAGQTGSGPRWFRLYF
jgi:hypothetical protein